MSTKRFGIAMLLCLSVTAAGTVIADDFLVPGVDFSKLDLRTGAWCRYIVVDEALNQIDSTEVYVAVVDAEDTRQGAAYWVELKSGLIGAGPDDGEALKLLILERITEFSEGDSFGDFVLRLYIKRGANPMAEEDPREHEEFSTIVPTADSSWVTVPNVPIGTPGGEFTCEKKTRSVRTEQEIPTGKIKLIKKARDDYSVWFCADVPVFRMARCVIERSRETDTVPRVTGIPSSGVKESRTAAELVAFGYDAKPMLITDPDSR
ncbi:MAG: hypothetical protein JSW50_09470 [Candidatus Latescibacterota bacterium]|nr:MAG: hypothetical protein JSW50_09470 [Candidatus Latescibacterota bacterium]